LRRITNIVRMGRVQRISATEIQLDAGVLPTSPMHIHVDCSSDGLARREPMPVFDGQTITLQSVRTCQQIFSAAFIAKVEASFEDEAKKNDLCRPVPHPNTDLDWLRTTLASGRNQCGCGKTGRGGHRHSLGWHR
jgi:hypothetical protein